MKNLLFIDNEVVSETEAVEAVAETAEVAAEESAQVDPTAVIENVTNVENIKEGVSELFNYDFSTLLQMAIDGCISFAVKVAIALAIYYVGRWVIRRVLKFMDKVYNKRNVDVSLRSFLSGIIKVLLYVVVILIVIQVLGINTSSLIAMLASAGLAVGLAHKKGLRCMGCADLIMPRNYLANDHYPELEKAEIERRIRKERMLV